MSKAKNYWYGFVKNNVVGRFNILDLNCDVERNYSNAVVSAMHETVHLINGNDRIEAIKEICVNKTETVESMSMKKYWSERTVRGWTNDFVNLVGKKAGFPEGK